LNFPNPMRDHTTFSWESNQVNQPVEVEIQIVALNGRPVKKISQTIYAQGYRTATIQWDGTQDDGSVVSSGLYVYSVQMTLPNGAVSQQTSKLVVIR
jgi:flagellar hook assembly protein FlgD